MFDLLFLNLLYSSATMFWQGIVIFIGVIFAVAAIVWTSMAKNKK